MAGSKTPRILVPVLEGGELARAWASATNELRERTYRLERGEAVYPYVVLKNKTVRNNLIKFIAVKVIMLVLLLVTPCAPRLIPPVLKMETEYYFESICVPDNKM
jgi:hypothetical protein